MEFMFDAQMQMTVVQLRRMKRKPYMSARSRRENTSILIGVNDKMLTVMMGKEERREQIVRRMSPTTSVSRLGHLLHQWVIEEILCVRGNLFLYSMIK